MNIGYFTTGRIFMKFDIQVFFENPLRKFKFFFSLMTIGYFTTGRIFMKFDIQVFFENPLRKFKFFF